MIQSRWTIGFSSFLVLLALAVPAAHGQILDAQLKVKGLACPFCAYGLERKLKKLPGAQVKILLNEDRAEVLFDGKQSPAVDDIPRLVHDAGFKLGELRLTLRGKRARCTDQPCLELPDGQIFLLENEGAGSELINSTPEGTRVEVTGTAQLTDHRDYPYVLRVESYQPVQRRRLRGGRN